jgi:hypothetical protein
MGTSWLWPIRTGKTFVDVWAVVHLSFWIFMGSCFWAVKIPRGWALLLGLVLAFGWEVFERFAEKRWPNLWLNPESWVNAYISDPMTCVIGVLGIYWALDRWGVAQ